MAQKSTAGGPTGRVDSESVKKDEQLVPREKSARRESFKNVGDAKKKGAEKETETTSKKKKDKAPQKEKKQTDKKEKKEKKEDREKEEKKPKKRSSFRTAAKRKASHDEGTLSSSDDYPSVSDLASDVEGKVSLASSRSDSAVNAGRTHSSKLLLNPSGGTGGTAEDDPKGSEGSDSTSDLDDSSDDDKENGLDDIFVPPSITDLSLAERITVECVHLLYNPRSGNRSGEKVMKKAKKLLEKQGVRVEVNNLIPLQSTSLSNPIYI